MFGLIENLAGGLVEIQSDQSMYIDVSGSTYFRNAGTVEKLAGTGTTTITIPFLNSGAVTAAQGTLNFNGGGTLEGTFSAAAGAAITFSGGAFTNALPAVLFGL